MSVESEVRAASAKFYSALNHMAKGDAGPLAEVWSHGGSDLIAAHALILAERAARLSSEARAAQVETDLTHAQATASSADALIARLRLEIEKLRRTLYGVRSERKERLIDQLEMQWPETWPTRWAPKRAISRWGDKRSTSTIASPYRQDNGTWKIVGREAMSHPATPSRSLLNLNFGSWP